MARPKKSIAERLSKPVRFDLRPSDFLHAVEAAEKAGMTLTAYARQQFLSGRVVIKQTRQLDYAAFNQLRSIGVNLNQIARKLHQTDKVSPNLDHICELLEKFLMDNIDDIQSKKGPKL